YKVLWGTQRWPFVFSEITMPMPARWKRFLMNCLIDELKGSTMNSWGGIVKGSAFKVPGKGRFENSSFYNEHKGEQADPEVPVPIIGRQTMSTCAPKA
ncbi:hypothetical protein, partial [Algoriphagus faecimaris]|uniref:hypothetical protein n=1 Tax=Algoriphagus faecimaris TaxID=686796 RepID=UPI00196B936D